MCLWNREKTCCGLTSEKFFIRRILQWPHESYCTCTVQSPPLECDYEGIIPVIILHHMAEGILQMQFRSLISWQFIKREAILDGPSLIRRDLESHWALPEKEIQRMREVLLLASQGAHCHDKERTM